ncbi:NAD-dependent glutamate dehydrogenase [Microbotryomycetes sp. JL221]|nr:NAD-dependent glutamate dehydrogenase [Microbotryomycetes sp. JL221]
MTMLHPQVSQHLQPPTTRTPSPGRISRGELGYAKVKFPGKEQHMSQVKDLVANNGFIPEPLVAAEVEWFFTSLGIDDGYFQLESVQTCADHIESLYGAKVQAHASHQDYLEIKLEKESENGAVFIYTSPPGVSVVDGPQYEQRIDATYLDKSDDKVAWRLESYRAAGNVSSNSTVAQQLRCYFLFKCSFAPVPAGLDLTKPVDIRKVSDKSFLEKATSNTLEIYQSVMDEALKRMGPVVAAYEVEGSKERRIVIGYKQGGTKSFFSALSDLYHSYDFYSTRKYVESFSNGITIISLYLSPLKGQPQEASVLQIMKESSLIYVLPNNPFFAATSQLSVQESAYAYSGWIFAQHFLNRLGSSYAALKDLLDESDPAQAAILSDIRARFRQETFTRASILETLQRYPDIIRQLYISFAMTHYYSVFTPNQLMPTLSYARLQTTKPMEETELQAHIKKTVLDPHDAKIFQSLMTFNKAILKTNFFSSTKCALSFRLDPSFLPPTEYPVPAYGLFMVVGDDFRGFHLRMKDVARGGIRMVMSRNRENYSINQRNLFDENYGLASTQALKNKDIPEGGSKGVILPDIGATPRICFEKYVDSIIDLLLPGRSPGIKEQIVDLYKKEEILFFGPDEGTADMMDWAATHARNRGAPWWKSFSTGKTASTHGGIPHDKFGMTSLSVRSYTTGIYRMLGLQEEQVTKVQTGGPDGDLGSNEILLSKDKTITIIDGSGTIHDPEGLDRSELIRLAKSRQMISNFDVSKLGSQGYRILVDEHDIRLPNGEIVTDGTDFRNKAHLRYKADILVPCGGRPESINANNMSRLWDGDNVPNFKYIVEGANLFITQSARLQLEKKGVILFRDSSANKGGVTSSSLEVLAGMALSDDRFMELMTSVGRDADSYSDFYLSYAREIQASIVANGRFEFDCIWAEHQRTGRAYTLISDDLSQSLIKLQNELEESSLFDDVELRRAVLSRAIPKTLLDEVGLDKILQRLPPAYCHSVFAAFLASRFTYQYGISSSPVDFHYFLSGLTHGKQDKN